MKCKRNRFGNGSGFILIASFLENHENTWWVFISICFFVLLLVVVALLFCCQINSRGFIFQELYIQICEVIKHFGFH